MLVVLVEVDDVELVLGLLVLELIDNDKKQWEEVLELIHGAENLP